MRWYLAFAGVQQTIVDATVLSLLSNETCSSAITSGVDVWSDDCGDDGWMVGGTTLDGKVEERHRQGQRQEQAGVRGWEKVE